MQARFGFTINNTELQADKIQKPLDFANPNHFPWFLSAPSTAIHAWTIHATDIVPEHYQPPAGVN